MIVAPPTSIIEVGGLNGIDDCLKTNANIVGNADNYTTPGSYSFNTGTGSASNLPANYGAMLVFGNPDEHIVQLVCEVGTSNTFIRSRDWKGFTSWIKLNS